MELPHQTDFLLFCKAQTNDVIPLIVASDQKTLVYVSTMCEPELITQVQHLHRGLETVLAAD